MRDGVYMRKGRSLTACVLTTALSVGASGQCDPQLTSLLQRAGVDGPIADATLWDPDGPGPIPQRLVVGGSFTVAGDVVAPCVAVFDFTTNAWSPLGTGMALAANWGISSTSTARVDVLLAMSNGELFAGGSFSHAGGTPVANVAKWNGTAWQPLASGIDGPVHALAALPNGDVVAAGNFLTASGQSTLRIARWNGTSWSQLGAGLDFPQPHPPLQFEAVALRTLGNGQLIASLSQSYGTPGGTAAYCGVWRWNGNTLSMLPSPPLRTCEVLTELPGGNLLAGGTANGSPLSMWNGLAWSSFGTSFPAAKIDALLPLANGHLLAGGTLLPLSSSTSSTIWSIAGASGSWSAFATLSEPIGVLVQLAGGDVLAGGSFASIGTTRVDRIARWNGSVWQDLAPSNITTNGSVLGAVATPLGYAVVGDFTRIGGVAANRVANWNGVAWQPLGSGLDGAATEVVRRSNGDLVVRGSFTTAGGAAAAPLARWNGATWTSLGYSGGTISRMVVMPNDDLVVAAYTYAVPGNYLVVEMHRWSASGWTTMPGSGDGMVHSMLVMPGGDLVVGGEFSWFGTYGNWATGVARWNGTTWLPFGGGFGSARVHDLSLSPTGQILVCGQLYLNGWGSPPCLAASVSGQNLQPIGPASRSYASEARVMASLPLGDVLLAGAIPELGGLPQRNLVRIRNASWWAVGDTPQPLPTNGALAKAMLPNGDVLLCGRFSDLAGIPAHGLIRLTPGCSPSTASLPSGCLGPAGPMIATAVTAPLLGGTLATQCTGFTASSLGLGVFGVGYLQPLIRLASVTPLGLPGCELIPTLELQPFVVPSAGVAAVSIPLPNSPALAGVLLWHQFVQIEFAGGSLRSLSTSNGLQFALQ